MRRYKILFFLLMLMFVLMRRFLAFFIYSLITLGIIFIFIFIFIFILLTIITLHFNSFLIFDLYLKLYI